MHSLCVSLTIFISGLVQFFHWYLAPIGLLTRDGKWERLGHQEDRWWTNFFGESRFVRRQALCEIRKVSWRPRNVDLTRRPCMCCWNFGLVFLISSCCGTAILGPYIKSVISGPAYVSIYLPNIWANYSVVKLLPSRWRVLVWTPGRLDFLFGLPSFCTFCTLNNKF